MKCCESDSYQSSAKEEEILQQEEKNEEVDMFNVEEIHEEAETPKIEVQV